MHPSMESVIFRRACNIWLWMQEHSPLHAMQLIEQQSWQGKLPGIEQGAMHIKLFIDAYDIFPLSLINVRRPCSGVNSSSVFGNSQVGHSATFHAINWTQHRLASMTQWQCADDLTSSWIQQCCLLLYWLLYCSLMAVVAMVNGS